MKTRIPLYISILAGVVIVLFPSCKSRMDESKNMQITQKFNPKEYRIGKSSTTKLLHGQVLYLPIYSTIPYQKGKVFSDLSAFMAIHNTDFNNLIKITKVQYIDNDGNLVKDYTDGEVLLSPLAAKNFFVPSTDKSGTGSNFILEWVSDSLVSEPLVESVIVGLTSGQGVSFISTGKVVREIR
jgi:hypothetical protein